MGKALLIKGMNFSAVALDKVTIGDSVPCTEVSLSSVSFDTHEESKQITATLTPENTTDDLSFASSNENVATVTNDGLVTIHGIGTAVITATCGNATDSITITQTQLKQRRAMYEANGYYVERISQSNNVIRVTDGSGNMLFGQAKNTEDTDLQIYGTGTIQVECIKVPHGATKCYIASKSTDFWVYAALYADTEDLTAYDGGQYPTYIKSKSGFMSNSGMDVEYGQCVVFRAESNHYGKPDYVYFT